MALPGVVMGEEELQALADVRGAPVQVWSLVCVRESSDFGATLAPRNFFPLPRKESAVASKEVAVVKYPLRRPDDTMMLLQEARTHRMSHFQLIRLPK
jgi:hypothetical protein